jgi:hypothetical protein
LFFFFLFFFFFFSFFFFFAGIGNIQKITKSMKMVAAAKLRNVQAALESARPFGAATRTVFDDFARPGAEGGCVFLLWDVFFFFLLRCRDGALDIVSFFLVVVIVAVRWLTMEVILLLCSVGNRTCAWLE